MNKKSGMPVYFAMAFVWFTTHFGGGFASGAQVVQYFVKFGWFAVFMPILSQLIVAIVLYYAWKFAVQNKVYDYRGWSLEFYKPVQGIMSVAFEGMYNLILIAATAVAFATGGATIEKVFGSSYMVNTIVIAIALFLLTIFGADLVRKAASIIALAIITGMVLIYVPNVIVSLPKIISNVAGLKSGAIQNNFGFLKALWMTITYAGFQSCCLGAYIAHSNVLRDVNDAKKSAIWGFIINSAILMLAVLGILAFYNDGILKESVPALFVVKNGIKSAWMIPLVSVLIILGAVSTGVNLIYGISQRIVSYLGREDSQEVFKEKETKRNIIVSAIYVIFTWCVAQFGLIPLVAKGYGTLGYIATFVIVLPIIIKGVIGFKAKVQTKVQA